MTSLLKKFTFVAQLVLEKLFFKNLFFWHCWSLRNYFAFENIFFDKLFVLEPISLQNEYSFIGP